MIPLFQNSIETLGVSLYPGSLPGKSRETELPNDEIEVGLGIHGEPGKFRAPYECARKIVTVKGRPCLDAPTPGWNPGHSLSEISKRPTASASQTTEIPSSGTTLSSELLKGCLKGFTKAMKESEDLLNDLDASAGDGDCGSTFSGAAKSIESDLSKLDLEHPETLFKQFSIIFEQSVGGTSGALYALMLSSAAPELSVKVDSNAILEALDKANQAVQKYGGARVGDRTMVDSLNAMVEELRKGLKDNQGMDVFERAVQASERAAEETAHQKASVGRASYTSSQSQTKPDAGATAISRWLRAIWEAFREEMGKK
uniref:Triokinase/FMN cyclase n=1 Tax=Caenorhabditis tropicalis TaxID=1561998 RepID=A0A1I7UBK0_9PELO